MLVGGESEVALVDLSDLLEPGLELLLRLVLDSSVLDEHREVVVALVVLRPAELVDGRVEREGALALELLAESSLDVGLEALDPHSVDSVLQTLLARSKRREERQSRDSSSE
jgi:hypothetical protein